MVILGFDIWPRAAHYMLALIPAAFNFEKVSSFYQMQMQHSFHTHIPSYFSIGRQIVSLWSDCFSANPTQAVPVRKGHLEPKVYTPVQILICYKIGMCRL